METTFDQAVPTVSTPSPTKAKLWIGRVLTGLPVALFAWGGLMSFMNIPEVIESSEKMGFRASTLPYIGAVEILAAVLLCIRRTAPFGAVLISAYLGGAVATHVRIGDPLLSVTLVPVYFAAAIWMGLYLRDERVRGLSPFKA